MVEAGDAVQLKFTVEFCWMFVFVTGVSEVGAET